MTRFRISSVPRWLQSITYLCLTLYGTPMAAASAGQGTASARITPETLVAQAFGLISSNVVDEIKPRTLAEAAIRGMIDAANAKVLSSSTDVVEQAISGLDAVDNEEDAARLIAAAFRRVQVASAGVADPAAIAAGAVHAMLKAADPEGSVEIPPVDPNREAIGVQLKVRDGAVVVASVVHDGPAVRAGVCSKDIIVSVGGRSVAGLSSAEVLDALSGASGTPARLIIRHEGSDQLVTVDVVRGAVRIPTIGMATLMDDGTGYVRLLRFDENTDRDLSMALRDLAVKGMRRLLLDLRDNSGGPLDQALKVANLFIPSGDLITYTRGRAPNSNKDYPAFDADKLIDFPVVVLVNYGTSSGTEIVATALKDRRGVTIVGTQTLGFDTVQSIYRFPDGTRMFLTTARWFTPKKRSVRPEGVMPDVIIESQNRARCEIQRAADNDSQLQEALAVFKKRPPTAAEVARLLVDRGAAVHVPSNGTAKSSIKKGGQTFTMRGGQSTVVLLRFPDYQTPYTMTISSLRRGAGATTEIFIPNGVYFDETWHWLGEFSENRLTAGGPASVGIAFHVDDTFRSARYLLLYTRGDLVGKRVGGFGLLPNVERSLEADIEVHTSPDKQRK